MHFLLLCIVSPLATALSVPLAARTFDQPTVTVQYGTVVGASSNGVESFKGIPYAQPPIGDLRMRPPRPITKTFGQFVATAAPKICPQFGSSTNTGNYLADAQAVANNAPNALQGNMVSEDCLTLDIVRPPGISSSAKLPVVFWIFGGGFAAGSASSADGTSIVSKSIAMKAPIVYVAVNYRVSGFGFMAGKEIAAEGSSNAGLKDQRLGLQWVHDNIAAFGGDPDQVTIWGASAGSISCYLQTIVNGGDNTHNGKPLQVSHMLQFRGAILNSGSVVPTEPVTTGKAQTIFNTVVKYAGCSDSQEKLACLRALNLTAFLDAVNSVPATTGYRGLDLSYLPRPDPNDDFFPESPEVPLGKGAFAKVPVIISDVEDEGTDFALPINNLTTTDQLIDYYATYFPTNPNARAEVAGLVATYPDDPSQGSPYHTGILWNVYPQYKRFAALIGDTTFTLTRRYYLAHISDKVKTWSYLGTYSRGTPVLGTSHGSDFIYAFNILGQANTIVGQTLQGYVISFVNKLDPNALGTSFPLIPWPQYSTDQPQLLDIGQFGNSLTPDDFRNASYQYLKTRSSDLRV